MHDSSVASWAQVQYSHLDFHPLQPQDGADAQLHAAGMNIEQQPMQHALHGFCPAGGASLQALSDDSGGGE